MENISTEDRAKITSLIVAFIPQAKISLFGSRARGTHSPRSDIDIAVDAGLPLAPLAIDEANSVMEATNIKSHIDVVDSNRVSNEMRASILQEGIVWKH